MRNYNIFTVSNDTIIEQSLTMLYSFLRNNSWFCGKINILYSNNTLSEENQKQLLNLYYNIELKSLDYDIISKFTDGNILYIKEGLKDILVENNLFDINIEDKYLYIDSNALIFNNIKDLFNNDIIFNSNQLNKKQKEEYYLSYKKWTNNYVINLGGKEYTFHKRAEDKDKYLVITCAKNENDYIREWINHYLNLNFDKVIICDNNDDDSLLSIISDYIEDGKVEVFDCRGIVCDNFQSDIISMFCTEGNYKWCGYFDCDEFLELGVYKDIKEYLKEKQGDCVVFNWILFDSNGQITCENKNIQDRFKLPYFPIINIENSFVKSIMRGGHFRYRDMITNGTHLFERTDGTKLQYNLGGYYLTDNISPYIQAVFPLRYKEGYIKHYYTKSFDEWIQKSKRGWGDNKKELTTSRFFRLYNEKKPTREKYKNTLFLETEVMDNMYDISTRQVNFYIYQNINKSIYPFLSRIMRVMSQEENKVFIIWDEGLTEEMCALFLECAFVTNNKIAFIKNESEINKVFDKYSSSLKEITYWIKSF